jgi:DNA-binding response OmpR family regulator
MNHKGSKVRRVLVAEDDYELRRLIAVALCKDGYEVIEAENGAQLVEHFAGNQPALNLVIADVRMPWRSGLSVLAAARSFRFTTPFILITGFADSFTRSQARQLGAVMIEKPFDLDELRAAALALSQPVSPTG